MGMDCQTCDDVLKKERGCAGKSLAPHYIGDETYWRCPLKIISGISYEYIRAYAFYKKGVMPNNGGWFQESDKYLAAMSIIESEITKIEQAELKKAKHGKKRSNRT